MQPVEFANAAERVLKSYGNWNLGILDSGGCDPSLRSNRTRFGHLVGTVGLILMIVGIAGLVVTVLYMLTVRRGERDRIIEREPY